ncbi:hypothetical protein BAE44_0008875 [Dichanthelium oligosanthes]|uniref:DUF547 domain-containing protein n=1 Tax=Dichanthelium oligosanthes TaxID=888268 RepID=A0A1E5VYB4_9POAL|nr:hypothetical protein BAE44_0008875 [Dichanthelium oligosanthes]
MEDPGLEVLKERGFCAETPSCYQKHRHSRRLACSFFSMMHIVILQLLLYFYLTLLVPRHLLILQTTNRNKMLHKRYSLNLPDQLPEHRIITTAERTERTISKSVADLAWEIAVLEEEVVRKELHLLSLYRAAFDQYLGVSPRASAQAFMAYGLQEKRMKSTDMILKAAYNVGGHSMNSQIIQNSILGCQSHRPSLWVRTLFTPMKKSGSSIHPYALRHPEPIAHFALSTGAFSDPPVRLYTAKKLYHQLEQARTEFVQANVMVRKQTIFLPKVLHFYAKDAALELLDLIDMVCESMPELQRKEIRQYLRRGVDKCVEWLPYKSSFRYTVHRNLAE